MWLLPSTPPKQKTFFSPFTFSTLSPFSYFASTHQSSSPKFFIHCNWPSSLQEFNSFRHVDTATVFFTYNILQILWVKKSAPTFFVALMVFIICHFISQSKSFYSPEFQVGNWALMFIHVCMQHSPVRQPCMEITSSIRGNRIICSLEMLSSFLICPHPLLQYHFPTPSSCLCLMLRSSWPLLNSRRVPTPTF